MVFTNHMLWLYIVTDRVYFPFTGLSICAEIEGKTGQDTASSHHHCMTNFLNPTSKFITPLSDPRVMFMQNHKPSSIIVDQDVFKGTYSPDKLKAREIQCEQIMCCLSPLLQRHRPIHAWLYGKAGTGKTTTAIRIVRQIEEGGGVKSAIINCWEKRSFYEILDEMVFQLRILRADEHRTSFKLEKLRSYLKDRPFLVVLDEVDQVKRAELSTILYNLDSILNAGLICISDSTQVLEQLEDRVRSRINPYTVFFPPYSRQNLIGILTRRAQIALAPDSWTRTALERIATASRGDARAAIGMLHRAAVLADHQTRHRITKKLLDGQVKAVEEARVTGILKNLTQDHQTIYKIVKQERQILSGDLWQKYLQRCERIKRKPLAPRTFSDYANRLVKAGLVKCERARVKGKVRLFKIAV